MSIRPARAAAILDLLDDAYADGDVDTRARRMLEGLRKLVPFACGQGLPRVLVFGPDGGLLFQTGIGGRPLPPGDVQRIFAAASVHSGGIVTLGRIPCQYKLIALGQTSVLACFAPVAPHPAPRIGWSSSAKPDNRMVFLSPASSRRHLRERMRRMGFSPREIEVGLVILRGQSNQAIADPPWAIAARRGAAPPAVCSLPPFAKRATASSSPRPAASWPCPALRFACLKV